MPRPNATAPHIQVQQALLEHVARYRLTVLPTVRRLPLLRSYSKRRVRSVLGHLCRQGYLGQAPLYRHRRYFYLAAEGAAWLAQTTGSTGLAEQRHGPLSELAKIHHYALLTFCLLTDAHRQRLTCAELQRHFPVLYRPGLPRNYYIDATDGPLRLGFVRVDLGGPGRWDRVLAAGRDDLERHWQHPGFQAFIRRGLFELTLITALPHKAQRLREELARGGDWRVRVIHIVAIPELVNLIAPPLR